jgi:hypothetical protein
MEIPYSSRYRLDKGFLMDVEKHQSLAAASFTKPEKDANHQPANWTFSTGPTVSDSSGLATSRDVAESGRLIPLAMQFFCLPRRMIGINLLMLRRVPATAISR